MFVLVPNLSKLLKTDIVQKFALKVEQGKVTLFVGGQPRRLLSALSTLFLAEKEFSTVEVL